MSAFPFNSISWDIFFRGMVFGFVGGFVLILLFLFSSGMYGKTAWLRPFNLLYLLAGLEMGIALSGTIVFLGFYALEGWRQRHMEQFKRGQV